MTDERWLIELEAYLDGELDPQGEQEFRDRLQADPGLKAELEARLEDRELFRQALGEDVGSLEIELEPRAERPGPDPRAGGLFSWRNLGVGLAVAAGLGLAILAPWPSRDDSGAEGPRSPITMSGQVAVLRYGEVPGQTIVLESGYAEFTAATGQRAEGL